MNPQFDQTPGLPLPQPYTGGQQPGYNPAFMAAPQSPSGPAPAYQTQAGAPMAMPQPAAQHTGYANSQPIATVPTPVDDVGSVADDEWVAKARDIVARYKGDPYMQSRELSKLKSQYVKARYNKDVKVIEERS